MSLHIIQPGLLASLQDSGRPYQQEFGIGRSGALDPLAYQLALRLLQNSPATAAIELFGGPFSLVSSTACWFAITGAEVDAELWQPQQLQRLHSGWRYFMPAGARLQVHGLRRGRCCYLSFSGGIVAEQLLGSGSTDLAAGFGGWRGRALQAQTRLELLEGQDFHKSLGVRQWQNDGVVRVLPGPEFAALSPASQLAFCNQAWQVSAQSNRMAARLTLAPGSARPAQTPSTAPHLQLNQVKEMLSHAVFPGVVQLPPNGLPIVLLADAQCTGGYPRIANVIRADLWKVAQSWPGQTLHFQVTERDLAARAWQQQQDWLRQIETSLHFA